MALPWHLYVMAGCYFLAGANHFRKPKLYTRIIPAYIPLPKLMNYICGTAEMVLAIGLCISVISSIAAWGIIALLIAIFPANIYMYTNQRASMDLPKWILLLRLPIQILLIIWAYIYS